MYSHNKDYEKIKQLIEEYIASRQGQATQNDVVHYISGRQDIPNYQKTSRVITIRVINELEAGDRIKISKGERQGQSHRLSINTDSKFEEIEQQIAYLTQVVRSDREKPGTISWDTTRWQVQYLFIQVKKLPSEQDSNILYPKIVDLMTELTLKEMRARQETQKQEKQELRKSWDSQTRTRKSIKKD